MEKRESVTILEKDYDKSVHNLVKLKDSEKFKFEKEMKDYARVFLRQNFDMVLRIPIKIDGRLTRAGGSFHFFSGNNKRSDMIKMSERFIACALHDEKDGIEAILDVLRHELVHYALFEQGRDFSDGDKDFENTLKELEIGSSGATAKSRRLSKVSNVWYSMIDIYQSSGKKYYYNHTKKKQSWIGERVSVRIIKTVF